MKSKVCICSSSRKELESTSAFLEEKGLLVYPFNNLDPNQYNELEKIDPDVVLLDLELKGTDGIELCYRLKNDTKLRAFIILFSKTLEDYIQVAAFKAGADDYIAMPVSPRLLLSRIRALLKRKNANTLSQRTKEISHSGISVDRDAYMVYKDEEQITLPRKEFEMLYLMISQPDKVFSRDEIFNRVWKESQNNNARIIDVHIRKIRQRVGQRVIKTIKGVGYKLA